MHPDLERLISLQHAENELRRLDTELAELPRQKAAKEAALQAEKNRLSTAKASFEENQKARRKHEGEVQDLEARRSKYKGQLNDVKTNKEYTALLHEIEGVEREIRAREDLILAEMETTESSTAEVKQEEALVKKAEEAHKAEVAVLDQREKAVAAQREKAAAERDLVAKALSPDSIALFKRIAKLRGVAVAEAKDGMCQQCHLKLRLQMYAEIKRNDVMFQCPACNRILYYEPPAPVVDHQP